MQALAIFVFALATGSAVAQENRPPVPRAGTVFEVPVAPVTLDGRILFRVRGLPAMTAIARATAIENRIAAVAADPHVGQERVILVPKERSTDVIAGQKTILTVFDADAAIEEVDRNALALANAMRIKQAIADYRQDRNRPLQRIRHPDHDSGVQIRSGPT